MDVTQDLVVTEQDCGTKNGVKMRALVESGDVVQALRDRIFGRVAAEDINNPETDELIAAAGTLIDENICDKIDAAALMK